MSLHGTRKDIRNGKRDRSDRKIYKEKTKGCIDGQKVILKIKKRDILERKVEKRLIDSQREDYLKEAVID